MCGQFSSVRNFPGSPTTSEPAPAPDDTPAWLFAGQQAYWCAIPFDTKQPLAWQRGWVIAAREGAVTLAESRTLIENRTRLGNIVAAALASLRTAITSNPAGRDEVVADLGLAQQIIATYDAVPPLPLAAVTHQAREGPRLKPSAGRMRVQPALATISREIER